MAIIMAVFIALPTTQQKHQTTITHQHGFYWFWVLGELNPGFVQEAQLDRF